MKTLIQAAVVTLFAASTAQAQQAVQWRVGDGGNGHWYRFLAVAQPWSQAQNWAQLSGGYLACISSFEENNFVRNLLPPGQFAVGYLGGFRDRSGWRWVSGEPWIFEGWNPGEPNGGPGEVVWIANVPGYPNGWNDHPPTDQSNIQASIIEWSADCNGDGIVDYGQILQGQLADLNSDGVPDLCQGPTCADADIYRDFNVNGADLGILLAQWGPNTPLTESDLNADGVVNGADLGLLLSFWGACP